MILQEICSMLVFANCLRMILHSKPAFQLAPVGITSQFALSVNFHDELFDQVVSLVDIDVQASGNVTLDTVSKIGSTGVTFISRWVFLCSLSPDWSTLLTSTSGFKRKITAQGACNSSRHHLGACVAVSNVHVYCQLRRISGCSICV